MRATLTVILCVILAGCGHYLTPLGSVSGPATPQQQEQDYDQCRDQSRASVENPKGFAVGAAGGASIVGLPGSIAWLQATRKAVFKHCMEERGYTVTQQ